MVDDCSADGSVAAVNAAITGSDRLRLVRHERNRGAGAARNTLLANAKGEFVAFFDDDDESRADRVSLQLERIIQYEVDHSARHVACFSSGERLYSNGYRKTIDAIGSRRTEPYGEAVADYLLYFRRLPEFFYGAGVPTNALMARRSTFLELGGFDASLRRVEDVDFAVRLALAGGHFIGIPERVLLQHATEGAEKSPLRNLEAEQVLVDKYRDYLVSKRRYYYARHWPLLRFWHFTGNYPRLALELLGLLLRNPVAVLGHILATGPARLFHERRMRKTGDAGR